MSVKFIERRFVAVREIWTRTILTLISSKLWRSPKQREISEKILVVPDKQRVPSMKVKIVPEKEIPDWAEANGHTVVRDGRGVLRYQENATVRSLYERKEYGGTKSQDSFWAKIRQNPTVRGTRGYPFRYTCAGV